MSSCVCTINEFDEDNSIEFSRSKIVKARKQHICEECGDEINVGDKYEVYVLIGDVVYNNKTCLLCKEIRDCFFCSWSFGNIWDFIQQEMFDENLNLSGLEELSKDARDKFFQKLDNYL